MLRGGIWNFEILKFGPDDSGWNLEFELFRFGPDARDGIWNLEFGNWKLKFGPYASGWDLMAKNNATKTISP